MVSGSKLIMAESQIILQAQSLKIKSAHLRFVKSYCIYLYSECHDNLYLLTHFSYYLNFDIGSHRGFFLASVKHDALLCRFRTCETRLSCLKIHP